MQRRHLGEAMVDRAQPVRELAGELEPQARILLRELDERRVADLEQRANRTRS